MLDLDERGPGDDRTECDRRENHQAADAFHDTLARSAKIGEARRKGLVLGVGDVVVREIRPVPRREAAVVASVLFVLT
jgi:hypothetical protein